LKPRAVPSRVPDAPVSGGPKNLRDAYLALGLDPDKRPGQVVNRRKGQVMVHLGLIDASFEARPLAFWSDGSSLKVLVAEGEFHPEITPSAEYHLSGGIAAAFDAFVQIGRTVLERIEDVERGLAVLEKNPLQAPPVRVLELKRQLADVREELGRSITGLADLQEGRITPVTLVESSPFRTIQEEFFRLRDLTQATQTALTDIFMIRQTEQANELQLVSNRIAVVSNRIAELSNISNIRMLGLSYVTLILAVVATVILFPNTAATILGMPSASNIPAIIVWMVLVGTAVGPIAWFVSQPWIREMFRGMKRYEARVQEGITDLPEKIPEAHSISPEPPGDTLTTKSSSSSASTGAPPATPL
jgi:hypothetical protein